MSKNSIVKIYERIKHYITHAWKRGIILIDGGRSRRRLWLRTGRDGVTIVGFLCSEGSARLLKGSGSDRVPT